MLFVSGIFRREGKTDRDFPVEGKGDKEDMNLIISLAEKAVIGEGSLGRKI